MPRFAANLTMMFNEVPFLDRFAEAAQAGFRAVEFLSPYDFQASDIAARTREHRLEVVLFNAAIGDWAGGERGLASLPGREHEFDASIANALRYAKALECPRLHVMAGLLPEGADAQERERRVRTYVRNLKRAAEEARAQDVLLLIEPINTRDIPRYLLNTQGEAHAIREEVGAANLKVQMDFYHCQIVEGDLSETFRRWQPHIGHVQIAGVPGRHEPDVGEIHYPHLFKLLDDLRYDGWIGCEYRPRTTTLEGLHWLYRLIDRVPPRPARPEAP
jgi:hydroxypyruvate isomerase